MAGRRAILQAILAHSVFGGSAISATREHTMATSKQLVEGPRSRLAASFQMDGKSAPIVFVHSDGGRLGHWDGVRAALASEHPTAAFDRRGHGASEAPANGSFMKHDEAGDIAAVAAAAGFKKFVLVGHSGGAQTAFDYAASHGQTLLGLVLVDPPPDPAVLPPGTFDGVIAKLKKADYKPFIESYYRGIAGSDRAVADKVLADALSTPQATMIGLMEALKGFDPKPLAAAIKMPALSIIQPQFDVEGALHRIPPGFGFEAIGGAGHWIRLAAPEAFLKVLRTFLTTLPS